METNEAAKLPNPVCSVCVMPSKRLNEHRDTEAQRKRQRSYNSIPLQNPRPEANFKLRTSNFKLRHPRLGANFKLQTSNFELIKCLIYGI